MVVLHCEALLAKQGDALKLLTAAERAEQAAQAIDEYPYDLRPDAEVIRLQRARLLLLADHFEESEKTLRTLVSNPLYDDQIHLLLQYGSPTQRNGNFEKSLRAYFDRARALYDSDYPPILRPLETAWEFALLLDKCTSSAGKDHLDVRNAIRLLGE